MTDFLSTIKLPYFSDNWGPFKFDFTDLIPPGTELSTVTVKAFAGVIGPIHDIEAAVETTDYIIDSSAVVHPYVYVYFKFDDTAAGKNTVVFEVTLNSGAKRAFFHQHVEVGK